MTAHRPGARQRAILAAMRDGATLYNLSGVWYSIVEDCTTYQPSATCRGLFEHGYIYSDQEVQATGGTRWRYVLTMKGQGTR